MCDKLTREKDKLEVDKEHIKHDLCSLQTEIQGNEKAVKSLQQTMDKLQKSKQKLNKVHEARAMGIPHVSTSILTLYKYIFPHHSVKMLYLSPQGSQTHLEDRIQKRMTVYIGCCLNHLVM